LRKLKKTTLLHSTRSSLAFLAEAPLPPPPPIIKIGTYHIDPQRTGFYNDTPSTVIVGSDDHRLYVLDHDGNLICSYETGGEVRTPPVVGKDGTIYFGSNVYGFYALNPDCTLKWSTGANNLPQTVAPIVADDAAFFGNYASWSHDIYKYTLDGELVWHYSKQYLGWSGFSAWSSLLMNTDGSVCIGLYEGSLVCVNPDGSEKFDYYISFGNPVMTPSRDEDGNIYFIYRERTYEDYWIYDVVFTFEHSMHYMYSLDINGNLRWSTYLGDTYRLVRGWDYDVEDWDYTGEQPAPVVDLEYRVVYYAIGYSVFILDFDGNIVEGEVIDKSANSWSTMVASDRYLIAVYSLRILAIMDTSGGYDHHLVISIRTKDYERFGWMSSYCTEVWGSPVLDRDNRLYISHSDEWYGSPGLRAYSISELGDSILLEQVWVFYAGGALWSPGVR